MESEILKIPPHDTDAEIAVLGSFMIDEQSPYKIADHITGEDFYHPNHRIVYDAVLDLFGSHQPIDIISVSNRLQEKKQLEMIGGISTLTSFINTVPTAANISHYASIIRKKRILRDMIEASHHINQLGYSSSADVDVLLDEAERKIFSISQASLRKQFVSIRSALEEAFERIDRLHKNKDELRGVSTGFKHLDMKLSGLQQSDLIILACRPSLGKTSFALNVARHAALEQNVPVGIFSLEMSTQQLIDRMLAAEAFVDLWRLRNGRLSDDEFPRLRDAMSRLSQAPLFIDDEPSINIVQMRAKARRLQAERGLGLIIVDYLQLMVPRTATDSMVHQVTEISRSLKQLARELNVPVLALSQLSRAVEQRHPPIPRLSDLRESGCLHKDTLIMRADSGERIPIKNLVGKTNIPVFSLNERRQLEIKMISRIFSSGIKQLFELKTKSGRKIKASGNHPFYTLSGWQRLSQLNPKTHIATPRAHAPTNDSPSMPDDEAILLAHLLGDGCVLPRQPIHYTSADEENIKVVSVVAERLFGINPRLVRQKNWWHVYLPSPYHLTHNRHHPIINWFNNLGIKPVRSYEKIVPQAIFTSSQKQIQLFLHHIWATDGNISFKKLPGRKLAGNIYYSTSSETLSENIQHLLIRIGILSTLRRVVKSGYKPNYQVHVQGQQMQLKFCNLVGSYGSRGNIIPELKKNLEEISANPNNDIIPKDAWHIYVEPEKIRNEMSWRNFSEKIDTAYCGTSLFESGLSRERMTRVAEALASPLLLSIAESDIYWDEIVSITPLGQEEVFDATVPDAHNFLANDFIVHNSLEQDADVVMFIYREDRYRENSGRPNQADILIEKHRNGPTGKVTLYFDQEKVVFSTLDNLEDYK